MNQSKISVRYSKALFALAKEQNKLDRVKKDIEFLLEVLKLDDFKDFVNSPIIPVSKKQDVFRSVFADKVDKIVLDTLLLMAKNRRETFLKLMALDYLKLYREETGTTEIELTTATEIPDDTRQRIVKLLNEKIKNKIEVKANVNPDIIGGFIVRIDDKQMDASVKTQLQNFKKELTKS